MISNHNHLTFNEFPSIKTLLEPCADVLHSYIWKPATALPGAIVHGGKRGAQWLAGTIVNNTPTWVKQCLSKTRRAAISYRYLTTDNISTSAEVRKQVTYLIANRSKTAFYNNSLQECHPLASKLWWAIDLPACCRTQQNWNIFIKTVQDLLINSLFDVEESLKLIQNVCTNLETNTQTAYGNVVRDLQSDPVFRSKFNLSPKDQILKITLLGEETHRGGKRPLQLVIGNPSNPESERTLVFKPRSMLPEELIAGREGSVCSVTGVGGVYTVHDKGEYGYAEWIDHNWNENVCREDEVDDYLDLYIALDLLMKRMNITDLHAENIITKHKVPYMIDLEVVDPTAKETLLARRRAISTPGYMPILSERGETVKSHNAMYIERAGGRELFLDMSDEMEKRLKQEEDSHAIEKRLEPHLQEVDSIRARLNRYPNHRFVAMKTSELNSLISHFSERTCEVFIETFQENLKRRHCEIVPVDPNAVATRLYRDTMNHDVPVFHINVNSGEIFYEDLLVAKTPSEERNQA